MAPAKKVAKKKAPAKKASTTKSAAKPMSHAASAKPALKAESEKFDLFSIFRNRAAEENAHGGPSGAI